MAKKTAAGGKVRKSGPKVKRPSTTTSGAVTGGNRFVGKTADQKQPDVKIQPQRIEKKRG